MLLLSIHNRIKSVTHILLRRLEQIPINNTKYHELSKYVLIFNQTNASFVLKIVRENSVRTTKRTL